MATRDSVDPRMRRTRKLLQDALLELLKQKPLAKIQIKEIAEAAELSRPTFYKQFETKEQLLFSHVDDVFDQIYMDIFAEANQGNEVDLFTLLTATFTQWRKHKELLQWVFQVENKDLVIKALQAQLREIKRSFDQLIPSIQVADQYEAYEVSFLSGGMYMLIQTWLENDMRESPEKMGSVTLMLIYNGFALMRSNQQKTQDFLAFAVSTLQSPP